MTSTEILLVINSVLLGVISLTFILIGYFLKDLHRDFKQMVDRVNKLNSEFNLHIKLFDNLQRVFQRQIDNQQEKYKKLEEQVKELNKKF